MYYTEYFTPYDTSANTTGDSSERASPAKEIQVTADIQSSLIVSNFSCMHNLKVDCVKESTALVKSVLN